MLKTICTRTALTITVIGLLAWSAVARAGQPDIPPNWGQADRSTPWICPTPTGTTGDFFNVPDLAVSITTTGNPVLLTIILVWVGYDAGSGLWHEPVIDGAHQPFRMNWQTGNGGEVGTLTFTRIYNLPAGTHTFGSALSCQRRIEVHTGGLTVYELPSIRR